jgi:glycosyltransferase involved in cell wall biosynthesis
MKLCIIVPAHNEEKRIGRMLQAYARYFDLSAGHIPYELLVVLNGCTDGTLAVVAELQQQYATIRLLDMEQAGKGAALITGFKEAINHHSFTHIGYVDADMATKPEYFYELIEKIQDADGIIASRYMPGAQVEPPRPAIKRWGSRLVYEPLIRLLFGMRYYDYQCGAKLFTRHVIEKVVPHLTVRQWAFDVELLYLCKRYKFRILEVPTIWHDQADSKLNIRRAGFRMLSALFAIRWRHRWGR